MKEKSFSAEPPNTERIATVAMVVSEVSTVRDSVALANNACDLTITDSLQGTIDILKAAPQPFDLVILDLNLVDSTGIETYYTVSTHCIGTPMLILTGQALNTSHVLSRIMHKGQLQSPHDLATVIDTMLRGSALGAKVREDLDDALRDIEDETTLGEAAAMIQEEVANVQAAYTEFYELQCPASE